MYLKEEREAILDAQRERKERTERLKQELEERSRKQRIETSVAKVEYSQPSLE